MQGEMSDKEHGANESGAEGNLDWVLLLVLGAFSGGDPEKAKEFLENMIREADDGNGQ